MTDTSRVVGLIVAGFAAVGLGLGVVTWAAGSWGQVLFLRAATGETTRFGPVFLSLIAFQTTVTGLMLAPALGGVLGTLAGSRYARVPAAAAVGGGGSAVGAVALGLPVAVAAVTTGGPQAYPLGAAAAPVGVAAVAAGVAGAAGGVVGSTLVR